MDTHAIRLAATILTVACCQLLAPSSHAAPILFDFEAPPVSDDGDGSNPTFSVDDFEVVFTNPDRSGGAQRVSDNRSFPLTGKASSRLTGTVSKPDATAHAFFSQPAKRIELAVAVLQVSANIIEPDARIDFISASGVAVETVSVSMAGAVLVPEWTTVKTTSMQEGFVGFVITGKTNRVYWDNLLITPVPEPAALALLGFAACFSVGRRWRR